VPPDVRESVLTICRGYQVCYGQESIVRIYSSPYPAAAQVARHHQAVEASAALPPPIFFSLDGGTRKSTRGMSQAAAALSQEIQPHTDMHMYCAVRASR
jgi:hypothetical protein